MLPQRSRAILLPPNSCANKCAGTVETKLREQDSSPHIHLMDIVKKYPKLSEYWSTNPLLKRCNAYSVMPRNHIHVLQFLHLAVNSLHVYKMQPVII